MVSYWYRTCETCDMVLIHRIRRLLFLLGVRQNNNCLPSRKNKNFKVAALNSKYFVVSLFFPQFFSAFVGVFCAFVVVVVLFSSFDRPLVGVMARSGILGAVVLVGSLMRSLWTWHFFKDPDICLERDLPCIPILGMGVINPPWRGLD